MNNAPSTVSNSLPLCIAARVVGGEGKKDSSRASHNPSHLRKRETRRRSSGKGKRVSSCVHRRWLSPYSGRARSIHGPGGMEIGPVPRYSTPPCRRHFSTRTCSVHDRETGFSFSLQISTGYSHYLHSALFPPLYAHGHSTLRGRALPTFPMEFFRVWPTLCRMKTLKCKLCSCGTSEAQSVFLNRALNWVPVRSKKVASKYERHHPNPLGTKIGGFFDRPATTSGPHLTDCGGFLRISGRD